MKSTMRFTATLEPAEEGGFVVQCVEIPGAISQGETEADALENIRDAIQAVFEVRRRQAKSDHDGIRVVEISA